MSEQNNHDTTNNSRRNPAAADGPSMQTAYFAGGCFWGLERYFQNVDGVTDTTVGYAQSKVESPSYEQVCAGVTDAAETVKVVFDPAQVTLRTLTLLFLEVIDPFSVDRQGEGGSTALACSSRTRRSNPCISPRWSSWSIGSPPARRSWSSRCATSTRPRRTIRII